MAEYDYLRGKYKEQPKCCAVGCDAERTHEVTVFGNHNYEGKVTLLVCEEHCKIIQSHNGSKSTKIKQ